MPDIEFHEIVGQIEDVAEQHQSRAQAPGLDTDPEALQREIQRTQLRLIMLAERLMA